MNQWQTEVKCDHCDAKFRWAGATSNYLRHMALTHGVIMGKWNMKERLNKEKNTS